MELEVLRETRRGQGCFCGYVNGSFGEAFGTGQLDGEKKA